MRTFEEQRDDIVAAIEGGYRHAGRLESLAIAFATTGNDKTSLALRSEASLIRDDLTTISMALSNIQLLRDKKP